MNEEVVAGSNEWQEKCWRGRKFPLKKAGVMKSSLLGPMDLKPSWHIPNLAAHTLGLPGVWKLGDRSTAEGPEDLCHGTLNLRPSVKISPLFNHIDLVLNIRKPSSFSDGLSLLLFVNVVLTLDDGYTALHMNATASRRAIRPGRRISLQAPWRTGIVTAV